MSPSYDPALRWRGYALTLLAAACWATGGLMAKWLFSAPSSETASWPVQPLGIGIDPAVLSADRALVAFVLLAVGLAVLRRTDMVVAPRQLPFLAMFGIAGLAMVHFTYFKAISLTNVATAILLEYLAPILVLVFSVLVLKHRLTWQLPVGVVLSVTGCALVVGVVGGNGLEVVPAGIAWGLASAVFFAAYSLMGSHAATRFSPWTTLVFGLGFAALFWLVVLGPARVLEPLGDMKTLAAVLYLAVASTIVPFGAFLFALKYIPPTAATVTSTVEPFIAGLGAYLLLGESFAATQILGGLLVVGAIAVVQLPEPPEPELPPAL